jgi:putative transcriptional regulator
MNAIAAIRKRLNLNQDELGNGIGCTQSNVGQYERGEIRMPIDRALRLIQFAAERGLKLSLDQCYGQAPLPPQDQSDAATTQEAG